MERGLQVVGFERNVQLVEIALTYPCYFEEGFHVGSRYCVFGRGHVDLP